MWGAEVGAPVATTDWDNRKLGKDDCTTDSRCDFLRALDAKTDMTVKVPDSNERLETSALASASLFLHRHNLHHFILEVGEEEVDNLKLLHWEREKIDLFHRFDFAVLHKTTELGNGDPLITVVGSKSTKTRRASTYHSFSSSLRGPRRPPRPPRPRPPRPRPNPPRPRPESAIYDGIMKY